MTEFNPGSAVMNTVREHPTAATLVATVGLAASRLMGHNTPDALAAPAATLDKVQGCEVDAALSYSGGSIAFASGSAIAQEQVRLSAVDPSCEGLVTRDTSEVIEKKVGDEFVPVSSSNIVDQQLGAATVNKGQQMNAAAKAGDTFRFVVKIETASTDTDGDGNPDYPEATRTQLFPASAPVTVPAAPAENGGGNTDNGGNTTTTTDGTSTSTTTTTTSTTTTSSAGPNGTGGMEAGSGSNEGSTAVKGIETKGTDFASCAKEILKPAVDKKHPVLAGNNVSSIKWGMKWNNKKNRAVVKQEVGVNAILGSCATDHLVERKVAIQMMSGKSEHTLAAFTKLGTVTNGLKATTHNKKFNQVAHKDVKKGRLFEERVVVTLTDPKTGIKTVGRFPLPGTAAKVK
jgi:hypothetical protein